MAARVFNLRNVPEDEADEVRQLLEDNRVDFYETPAGNWGMSMPALWVSDDDQKEHAKAIIADYQEERAVRMREEYVRLKAEGRQRRFLDLVGESPMRFVLYLFLILFFLYISVSPFLKLGEN
ncbi:DUF6164 family protein [Pseudomonadota bacterium]